MKYKLGIGIPYYKQNRITEILFKELCELIKTQLNYVDGVKLLVYENNEGIAKARNRLLNELIKDCNYITFIDADDYISFDYIEKIVKAIETENLIYITKYNINGNLQDQVLKNHVTGIIYKNEVIKDLRFNENRNIGEDTEFNSNFRNYNTTLIDTTYFYNLGINNDCLSYKFNRGEINEFKEY